MTQTCSNVLMGGARVFYAPKNHALPDETTVGYGGTWGGSWTEVGLTNAPLSWGVTTNMAAAMVEQRLRSVRRRITSMEEIFETQLAEITATSFSLVVEGSVTTSAADSTDKAYSQFDAAGNDFHPTERAWGFEGENIDGDNVSQPIRWWIPAAVAVMNGNLELSRESDGWGIPMQIMVNDQCDGANPPWRVVKVTGGTTA